MVWYGIICFPYSPPYINHHLQSLLPSPTKKRVLLFISLKLQETRMLILLYCCCYCKEGKVELLERKESLPSMLSLSLSVHTNTNMILSKQTGTPKKIHTYQFIVARNEEQKERKKRMKDKEPTPGR